MINIKVSNNLQRRIDQIEFIPIKIKQSIDMGLLLSTNDVHEEVSEILGDKARWFQVTADPFRNSLIIGPTEETEVDSEKMRYVEWALENHGEEMYEAARRIVKLKTMQYYRGGWA
jgi:hypothetical protein